MKKLWTLLLAVILFAGAVLPLSRAEDEDLFFGSFTTDKTYSCDLRFYALQTAEQVESYREIVVTVYETASDAPVFTFKPDRASDHWGICWERDSYDIWVQSGDTGTSCWEYLDGEWKHGNGRVCPEYIVSRWNSAYREHPETWPFMYRTLTDPPAIFPAAEMVRAAVHDDFCCVIGSGEMELTFRGIYARMIFIELFGTELMAEEDQTAGVNSFPTVGAIRCKFLAGSPENGETLPVGYYQIDSQGRIAFSSTPEEDPIIVCKPTNEVFYDRLVYVMFAVAMAGGNSDALSKEQIFSLVQDHHDFLLRCITDNDPERAKEVMGIQSVRIEKDVYVEFYCGGSGLVPSSSYYGLLQSGRPPACGRCYTDRKPGAGRQRIWLGRTRWRQPVLYRTDHGKLVLLRITLLKRMPSTLRELIYEEGVFEVKAKQWLIMIILFLYVIANCMGELLRWSVPLWAGFIDILLGLLLLYWAYRAFSQYFR